MSLLWEFWDFLLPGDTKVDTGIGYTCRHITQPAVFHLLPTWLCFNAVCPLVCCEKKSTAFSLVDHPQGTILLHYPHNWVLLSIALEPGDQMPGPHSHLQASSRLDIYVTMLGHSLVWVDWECCLQFSTHSSSPPSLPSLLPLSAGSRASRSDVVSSVVFGCAFLF